MRLLVGFATMILVVGSGGVVSPAAYAAPVPPAAPVSATAQAQALAHAQVLAPARPPRRAKTVALTFDDGPDPRYTLPILKILKKHRVKATFCVLGSEVVRHPHAAKLINKEGHRLCNHTYRHDDLARLSPTAVRKQVYAAQGQIKKVGGVMPSTFRFPYGSSNARARKAIGECRLRILPWDIDTRDWQRPTAHTITARIVNNVRPGDVVLMHDGGGDRTSTVNSLDATIRLLKRRGYTFVLA